MSPHLLKPQVLALIERAKKLFVVRPPDAHATILECLYSAIDVALPQAQAGNRWFQDRLVEIYTLHGDVLREDDSMDAWQAAIESFDQALYWSQQAAANQPIPEPRLADENPVPEKLDDGSPPRDQPDPKFFRLSRDESKLSPLVFPEHEFSVSNSLRDEWEIPRMSHPIPQSSPTQRPLTNLRAYWFFVRNLNPYLQALLVVCFSVLTWRLTLGAGSGGEEEVAPIDTRAFSNEPVELLTRFMEATSWEELLPLIRHPEVMEPIMRRWYAAHPFQASPDFQIVNIEDGALDSADGDGLGERWVNLISVQRHPKEAPYTVFVELTSDGYKIDWETAVQYQGLAWTNFLQQRTGDGHYFRVHVGANDYYNYQFSDPREWLSFKVRDPYTEMEVPGFARRHSSVGRKLQRYTEAQGWTPVIVELEHPQNGVSDSVQIASLLQKEWLVDYPLEGGGHFDLDRDRAEFLSSIMTVMKTIN